MLVDYMPPFACGVGAGVLDLASHRLRVFVDAALVVRRLPRVDGGDGGHAAPGGGKVTSRRIISDGGCLRKLDTSAAASSSARCCSWGESGVLISGDDEG